MKAASKCASCARSPSDRPRLRWTSPRSGSSRPAAILSSVVLPPPFGPTRPTRSPSAIAASTPSRIVNVPTSRVTPAEAQDRHQPTGRRACGRPPGCRGASGSLRPRDRVDRPLPARIQVRPAPTSTARAAGHGPEDRPRAGAIGGRQALTPRAEMRGPRTDHDPLDRAATPRTRLARCAGRPPASPASSRRRRVPCSRRSRSRAARRPRPGPSGSPRTGGARPAGGGTSRTAAGGGVPATAPRRRRCSRRPPGTTGR